jgi:lipopolysaccharide/colanic/teichoic acid biosynthesis glycosyltransferase
MHDGGIPRWLEAPAATITLVLLAPFFAVVAVLIRISSPGPAFFRQPRAGRGGRPFAIVKFRTMRVQQEGPQVTSGNDPRITPFGRWLRKTKLDEVPQLWNVVKGDMSFVGPRPEVMKFVDLNDPRWQIILQSRPGVSDPVTMHLRNEEALLATVKGDTEAYYREVLQPRKLDGYVAYLRRRTFRSDVAVLVMTALTIVLPHSRWVRSSDRPT